MDMNLIKMKQDVLARKEKRLREMNKRVDEETLTIVVAYSQESIMSQQNIMREILSWLPVKSLLRFKCVSKSWDITRDPYFRMKHQSRHEVNSQRFLLLRAKFDIYTQYFHDLYSTSSLSSLDDVQRIDYLSSRCYSSMDILCGSCDGLVLIRVLINPEYLLLWNPSTRESVHIPFPIFGLKNSTFGFGYDPTTHDYKILAIHHEKITKHNVEFSH
uniref:Putative ovule protein n=1 Tax=Solanum chacoense TaxID=4108 RepID=A0A0V0HE80_SOLCH